VTLIEAADRLGMVLEVTLFSQEKEPNLPLEVQELAAGRMAEMLKPYRNLILQIWNESSAGIQQLFAAAKAADPERIVTNSPGIADVLGDDAQNEMLDLLSPHTVRHTAGHFWEEGPQQIAGLIARFNKPVIDDEPARTGTAQFGGIEDTTPQQHIAQVEAVRKAGGYHLYHHDMFQLAYGSPVTPPHGVPDPDFSPFHRQVFDYLKAHPTW
jgi:hypothetical protein